MLFAKSTELPAMNKTTVLGIAAAVGMTMALPGFAQDDVLRISVSTDRTRAQPIAIVPFVQSANIPTDIAQIIDDDLARSGMFITMPRANMIDKPTDVSQINVSDWRRLGQSDVVIGKVDAGPAPGSISVSFNLVDVLHSDSATVILNDPGIAGPNKNRWRHAAHKAADEIFEKLTQMKGIFDTQIAYITSSGVGASQRFQFWIADADGQQPHMIATSHEPLMSPAWSPDGRRIAFVGFDHGNSAIYVQTPSTGELRKFVGERGINGAPSWSPDGNRLAVTLSFEHNPDIYIIDVGSGSRTRVTYDSGVDTEAAWSPDGSTLAWVSDRGGQPQIYTTPAGGGGPQTRLTFQGVRNEDPAFSPDGKTLALANNDGSGYRIGLLDLQTHALRIISDGPLDEHPRFAPNGQVVIYTSQGSHGEELKTASVDGRVHQTLSQAGNVRTPAWGPFQPGN
jgi:TolB protein